MKKLSTLSLRHLRSRAASAVMAATFLVAYVLATAWMPLSSSKVYADTGSRYGQDQTDNRDGGTGEAQNNRGNQGQGGQSNQGGDNQGQGNGQGQNSQNQGGQGQGQGNQNNGNQGNGQSGQNGNQGNGQGQGGQNNGNQGSQGGQNNQGGNNQGNSGQGQGNQNNGNQGNQGGQNGGNQGQGNNGQQGGQNGNQGNGQGQGDHTTYKQLQASMETTSFKYNLATLKLLTGLQDELETAINEVSNNMFDLPLRDAEIEEHYDLALRTAREIRKTFIKEDR